MVRVRANGQQQPAYQACEAVRPFVFLLPDARALVLSNPASGAPWAGPNAFRDDSHNRRLLVPIFDPRA